MSTALVRSRCCEYHRPGAALPGGMAPCCDLNDCGPCCPDCPTCPTQNPGAPRMALDTHDSLTVPWPEPYTPACPACGRTSTAVRVETITQRTSQHAVLAYQRYVLLPCTHEVDVATFDRLCDAGVAALRRRPRPVSDDLGAGLVGALVSVAWLVVLLAVVGWVCAQIGVEPLTVLREGLAQWTR